MRIVMMLAAIGAAMLVQGCTTPGGQAAVEVAQVVETPAIVATEAAMAADFRAVLNDAENARPPMTPTQCQDLLARADRTMALLELARLAYDATLGADSSAAAQALVAAARENTDRAYRQLTVTLIECPGLG